jgi:hypothetical protein
MTSCLTRSSGRCGQPAIKGAVKVTATVQQCNMQHASIKHEMISEKKCFEQKNLCLIDTCPKLSHWGHEKSVEVRIMGTLKKREISRGYYLQSLFKNEISRGQIDFTKFQFLFAVKLPWSMTLERISILLSPFSVPFGGSGTESRPGKRALASPLPKKEGVSPVKPLQRHTPIISTIRIQISKNLKSSSLRVIAFRTVI